MKFEIKHRFSGEVLFSIDADSFKIAVELAIKARADLRYADLYSADLRYANLRYANLSYANLRYADLYSADLSSADLRYADLRYANLRYADLRYANLSSANGFNFKLIQIINTRFFITIFDDHVVRGCRKFSFSELAALSLSDCNEEWDEDELEMNKKMILDLIKFYRSESEK